MKNIYLILILSIAYACQYSDFTDLTPEDGFKSEFAFNVPLLNEVVYNDGTIADSGWIEIDPILDIFPPSPFIYDVQYIATDTFAFEWEDYEPVVRYIHRMSNNFDITFTTVNSTYKWLNYSQFYSSDIAYLIPLFNSKGQRYWLQVFRDRKNFFQTYYTARGVWVISKPKTIDGDVS